MKYEVWLGSIELYAVESVEESAERKITVYDAVGAGKFPQAENRGLKSWGIQCELTEHNDRGLSNWTEASEIFDGLEALLNKKSPARLVIRSDYGKASERVLLKSFSKEETVSGVYAVKIACTEYVSAAVRTTDVPYVARPGKLPEVPKVAKISYKDPGKSPFELMTQANRTADSPYGPLRGVRKRFSSSEDALKYIQSVTFLDPKTLQTRNPAALKDGDKVHVQSVWSERPEWAGNDTLVGMVWSVDEAVKSGFKKLGEAADAATKFDLPAAIDRGLSQARNAMAQAYDSYEHEWKYR